MRTAVTPSPAGGIESVHTVWAGSRPATPADISSPSSTSFPTAETTPFSRSRTGAVLLRCVRLSPDGRRADPPTLTRLRSGPPAPAGVLVRMRVRSGRKQGEQGDGDEVAERRLRPANLSS